MNDILKQIESEEVEWVEIGKLLSYKQPTKYRVNSTVYNDDYKTPVLTAGQTFILGYTNEKNGIYNASKSTPVIIFDDFTTANKWVDFPFKVKSSAMKILTSANKDVNIRYCYYYMQTINVDITEHRRMWISNYSKIKIPLPSKDIQEKIVSILDIMTELTAELTARTKQYEYYRNMLLSEEYLNKLTMKLTGETLEKLGGGED